MARIFISYRRQDSPLMTGRIYDRLERAFGENKVFRDIDDIGPGEDFRAKLAREIDKSDILLIIIGPKWESISDEKGNRRLDDPDDFVRLEVEGGLKRTDKIVIPVLVEGTSMPQPNRLTESLRELCYRNAVSVRQDPDFNHDMERLIHEIKRIGSANTPVYKKRPVLIGVAILLLALLAVAGINLFGPPLAPVTDTPVPTHTIDVVPPTDTQASPVNVLDTVTVENPSDTPEPTPTFTPSRPLRIGVIGIPDYLFTDITERLSDFGFDAEWIGASSDYAVFSQYDVVYLPIGWAFQEPMIESRATQYQRFVEEGGGLVVEQPNYSSPLTPDLLPYRVTFKRKVYDPNEWPPRILHEHEIIDDVPVTELPGPGNELSTKDENWTVITVGAESNSPTLLAATYGQGRIVVIATSVSQNDEVRYRLGDTLIQKLLVWVSQ
ncbi:MAG: toll/interleukin-1 receptor domain-containing protein [Chloroflexota bacterium]